MGYQSVRKWKNLAIILFGKIIYFLIKKLSLGSGSTWPGEIALNLNSHFVQDIFQDKQTKIILIVGTNGKTTTASLLKFILQKRGWRVFHNLEGANLLNGIASSLIRNLRLNSQLLFDFAIFEVDEYTFPQVLRQISPHAIVILNLFRDQLDRYGEVRTIVDRWAKGMQKLTKKNLVIINADDPQLYYLGCKIKAKVFFYGIDDSYKIKKDPPHDVDSLYCPNCLAKLRFTKIAYSHLGNFSCSQCSFKRGKVEVFADVEVKSRLKGVYNRYNINALLLLSKIFLKIPIGEILKYLEKFVPPFGRQEIINYQQRKIFLLLSKNPTGFNQSIDIVGDLAGRKRVNVLLLLNDRIPDGHDVSWIWDVEFERLHPSVDKIFISGDRAYDMAIRIKYCLKNQDSQIKYAVIEDLKKAIEQAVKNTKKGETLYILATYSAMLEARKILLGRKLA